jgi:hypothetical protein
MVSLSRRMAFVLPIVAITACGGPEGPSGPKGADGTAGATGATGTDGLQGATGLQGDPGATGATGAMGAMGATGAQGATGPTVDSSISAVSPTSAYIGRTLDVLISGSATKWDSSTTVSFGSDVTVNSVTVGSETALWVNITIPVSSAAGAKDITVTDAAGTETLTGIFSVGLPVSVTPYGTVAQGSVVLLQLQNLDPTSPFDGTTDANGNYTNFTLATLPGTNVQVNAVSAQSATVLLLIDVDATETSFPIDAQSGPPTGTVVHYAGGSLAVAARTATVLGEGVGVDGSIATAWSSDLYQLATEAPNYSTFTLDTTDTTATLLILDATGHFTDGVTQGQNATTLGATPGGFYAIVIDPGGMDMFDYTLTAVATNTTFFAPQIPDATTQTADVISSIPAAVTGATLADGSDANYYAFTATANQAGQLVNVQVLDNPNIDVYVEIFGADGTTALDGGGIDTGFDGFSDVATTGLPSGGGTFYVVVTPGYFWDPTQGAYDLLVTLQ